MTIFKLPTASRLGIAIMLALTISGCSETSETSSPIEVDAVSEVRATEPGDVDIEATRNLQDSLMSVSNQFASMQNQNLNTKISDELETGTDAHRQSLIDSTLEKSTERVARQADKLAGAIERIKEIEHSPLPDT